MDLLFTSGAVDFCTEFFNHIKSREEYNKFLCTCHPVLTNISSWLILAFLYPFPFLVSTSWNALKLIEIIF